MAADVFFNRKISSRYRNRVEKERFTLQPVKAKKLLNKPAKPSSRGIEFTERQLQIAIAAMKGKP
jgi:hypothetical protein